MQITLCYGLSELILYILCYLSSDLNDTQSFTKSIWPAISSQLIKVGVVKQCKLILLRVILTYFYFHLHALSFSRRIAHRTPRF